MVEEILQGGVANAGAVVRVGAHVLRPAGPRAEAIHDAATGFVPPSGTVWSDEMCDPDGGTIICHNDVCLENVVFRDGVAVALLDFEFVAPGRPAYDVAAMARMCVPAGLVRAGARSHRRRLGWSSSISPSIAVARESGSMRCRARRSISVHFPVRCAEARACHG